MSGELSVFQRFKDSRPVRQARIMLGLHGESSGVPKPQGSGSPRKIPIHVTTESSLEPDWRNFEGCYGKSLLPHSSNPEKTIEFLAELFDILQDYIRKENDRGNKVLDFHHPHQLREILDHCIDVDESPRDLEQILSDCKETLKYCVKTGHPRFFNQLSSGLDVIGMAGEWLTATANTNMFTYEVAPVFTLMEDIVLTRMRSKVGWSDGDGILVPGGALANLYSVLAARYTKVPDTKFHGMRDIPQLVMFTSEQGHFSIRRSAAIMGIGMDNVIQIPCDERGKMLVHCLESEIVAALNGGYLPFYVNATCGTTVLGAYDPVNEIADVCEKHGLWLHVDRSEACDQGVSRRCVLPENSRLHAAVFTIDNDVFRIVHRFIVQKPLGAWGGSVLMSNKHRHLLDGIERAQSMTWNPHKLMGVPLQCSAILLRDKGVLQSCNSMQANYLFQQDKNYDIGYDTGDKAIQCGRHNDIFKLWLMWRSKGDRGFEDHINIVFEHAEYLRRKIRDREGFQFVVRKGELTNVCFWYVPKSMRHLEPGDERDRLLNTVAPKIKSRMMEAGSTLVGYQPLGKLPNFFRMVISNPGVTEGDLDFLVEEIERLGNDI